jgi:hypothetical protein
VRLLRDRLLDQAVEVREAGVGSARAAGLDRRRVGVEADDADVFRFSGQGIDDIQQNGSREGCARTILRKQF